MPVAMSVQIQSVAINDTVYVGGGWTDRREDAYIYVVSDGLQHTVLPVAHSTSIQYQVLCYDYHQQQTSCGGRKK